MTTVWLVRHGATKMNATHVNSVDKIRGWSDVPLSSLGREEANKVGKQLRGKGIKAMYTSDLDRAKETAEIISKYIKVTPKYFQELRPWDLGEFTGKDTKEALPKILEYIEDKPEKPVPKGESFDVFRKRAFSGLGKILRDHPNDIIAVITHHRIERLLKAWIAKGKPANFDVDLKVFGKDGEPPGSAEKLELSAPKGGSLRNTIKDVINDGKDAQKPLPARAGRQQKAVGLSDS